MTRDLNKDITNITYNHLNLPTRVHFGASSSSSKDIYYTYDATGTKIEKKVQNGGYYQDITLYAGNMIYSGNTHPSDGYMNLQFFNTPEGYVEPKNPENLGEGYNYIYQYKDHLGNVRLSYSDNNNDGVITASSEIVEENNYYPFGLEHKGYNNVVNGEENNYQTFQGQEISKELGYNILEFRFRHYDPSIGRFFTVDPLTEQYTDWGPYVFSGNRVIDARELEGLEPHSVHKTLNGAATNFGQQYNGRSIINGVEYSSRFYSSTRNGVTTYSYVEPLEGSGYGVGIPDPSTIPEGGTNAGDIHSHGDDEVETIEGETDADNVPSDQDIQSTIEGGLPSFVVTPSGTVQRVDPNTGEVSVVSTDVPSDPKSPKRTNSINPSLEPYVPSRPKVTPVNITPRGITPVRIDTPNIDELLNGGGTIKQ